MSILNQSKTFFGLANYTNRQRWFRVGEKKAAANPPDVNFFGFKIIRTFN